MLYQIANEQKYIEAMQADEELKRLRAEVYAAIAKYRYTYNLTGTVARSFSFRKTLSPCRR